MVAFFLHSFYRYTQNITNILFLIDTGVKHFIFWVKFETIPMSTPFGSENFRC